MKNPIFVALDVPTLEQASSLADVLSPVVGGFKVGSELFTTTGPEIVKKLRGAGAAVFLDLKYHDIPNTVSKAVAAATRLGVSMLTVHASGGFEMLAAAEAAAQDAAGRLGVAPPVVLAVTVLTSMDQRAIQEVGVISDLPSHVENLARLAMRAGLRGLVCSPLEVAAVRRVVGSDIQIVTPGIRAAADNAGDQKRTLSATEALALGANWLVIGRPICGAPHPRAAAEAIVRSISASNRV